MSDETKYAYYAGIVDGEGSVLLNGTHAHFRQPYLAIAQKDAWFIKQVVEAFPGGLITNPTSSSDAWKAVWNKAEVIENILVKLLPYLVIKQEEAAI